ncbi:SURF4 family-domain-containing protein [Catenaria anguillulae PL171]|uniref:SURF4 family-domain-containing protein n=1 Tax=Catenaria anguillulae PL171 TaxID=765915 RepID=A0A1Y2HET4_9FUNG|nr:SURF4 family-domain-containing protein [Catenaria anguillulae PL171]
MTTLQQFKPFTSQVEDTLDRIGHPLKPYLPGLARFLLVVTFLEDSLRIVTQWEDQLWYLEKHRGMPWGVSHTFLMVNVLVMLVCSTMAIAQKQTNYAVAGLFAVILSQSIGYGLLFDFAFFIRNLSVIGGLLMLLAEAYAKSRRSYFPGLPALSETDKSTYLQLGGRVLLVLLFISIMFAGEFTLLRAGMSVIGAIACLMVAVGFKAKWSALFLVVFLSLFNVLMNNWWSLHHTHPQRDYIKYDFFQTLSIMGGFLLLVNLGPGGISVDEKKKY